jgi:hypothetical protein
MPAIHDIKCESCGHHDDDVLVREKDVAGNWISPPCTECGGGTSIRFTTINTPSTCRRTPPRGLESEFGGSKGQFAWRSSKERLEKHKEDRRKGRPGNQDEFSQFNPLTPEERKETGIKEPEVTNEVKYIPKVLK